jgi:hypothetical protein
MKWVARERPRIGRVACAGLIARIVDVSPEFLCVPGGNPRQCWRGCGGVFRRNREFAGTENGKQPETGLPGSAASVAGRPEPAPALGGKGEKNQPRVVGFLNSGGGADSTIKLILEGPA